MPKKELTLAQMLTIKKMVGTPVDKLVLQAIKRGVITFKWDGEDGDWKAYHVNLGKAQDRDDWNAVLGLQMWAWCEDKKIAIKDLPEIANFVKAMSATYTELVEAGKITDKDKLKATKRKVKI